MNLSAEEIAKATGSTLELAEKFRPYLNKYMNKYGINTAERRGLIQLTGRANYEAMSKKVNKDLVNNPQLVEQPDLATEVSAIFWRDTMRGGLNLNQWADKLNLQQPVDSTANWQVHTNITKAINGGVNGIDDRASRMKKGSEIYAVIKKKVSGGGKKTKRIAFFSIVGLTIIGLSIYAFKKYGK